MQRWPYPVYLPLLAAEISTGSPNAIEGIAAIPTAEAADELLRIAEGQLHPLIATEPRQDSSQETFPLSHFQAAALLALAARLPVILGPSWDKNPSHGMVATMDLLRTERLRRLAFASTAVAEKSLRSAAARALACCVGPAQRKELLVSGT